VKRKHARGAFSGEGARLYGGRWNNPGTPLVYTAQSQSLATLEMLVHLDTEELLARYVFFAVSFSSSLISEIDASQLPKNWRNDPPPARLKTIGDVWAAAGKSAVLRVPSAIVPGESNFLLNPRHRDFHKVAIDGPEPFRFDSRLKGR
jgi:RES domain-containing protein